ncbi:MAG: ClpXP protease specificity-enhancing factor SspB, partial [Phenylobacterium sp.]|uniref:ClpXP protease specificity-enhancing factor SspB n=1 Tax=Phenylobacterium sp. TaxID=1871053 RepID=UPI002A368726
MAQEPPAQDLMHYEAMAQEALRGVVKAALKRAAAPGGLPGAHHFYITFKTDAPGVSGPPDLLSMYPDEMTIVLQ